MTELCFLQRCEKLCEIIKCIFSTLLKKLQGYQPLLFVLSNNACKTACKMPSFVLFPFTDKINESIISKVFVVSLSVCFKLKGQLQRFYKLISNDRIWPSEHGFEVIFEKSLFVFEISAFKVRNKRGIHSRFHSFSENINRETFVCDVTSDQSSMISTERSDLRDCKASGNCYV